MPFRLFKWASRGDTMPPILRLGGPYETARVRHAHRRYGDMAVRSRTRSRAINCDSRRRYDLGSDVGSWAPFLSAILAAITIGLLISSTGLLRTAGTMSFSILIRNAALRPVSAGRKRCSRRRTGARWYLRSCRRNGSHPIGVRRRSMLRS